MFSTPLFPNVKLRNHDLLKLLKNLGIRVIVILVSEIYHHGALFLEQDSIDFDPALFYSAEKIIV